MLARVIVFVSFWPLFSFCGCGSNDRSVDDEAAKKKIAAIAADSPSTKLSPSLAAQTSGSLSAPGHPIDNVEEGKKFRIAARALDRGDFEAALRIRDELKQSPQYSVLATALDALTLVKQGKLDEAIALAEEVSAVPVMQCDAYVIAGEVFQRQNRLNEAIAAFENALQINPLHVRAHLWLGSIYHDTGAMGLAPIHLRKAAELEPTEVKSLLLSARIFQDYEQYPDAIQDYRKVLDRADSEEMELSVRVKLAECLSELRQLEEATAVLRDCPETPGVLALRATVAEASGDMETAVLNARRALRQSPGNRIASLVLGRILVAERKWGEAVGFLEAATESDPFDHETKLLYGRALVGSGEIESGKASIQKATELKDLFLKFADLHHDATKHPTDAAIRVSLGQLAEKLGKIELAKSWYRAAIGLDPKNQEAAQSMAQLKQAVPHPGKGGTEGRTGVP